VTYGRGFFRAVGGVIPSQKFAGFIASSRPQTPANNVLAGGKVTATPLSLRSNHWYDIVLHFRFSPDPSVGLAEWYVDEKLRFSGHLPTLTQRTDGSILGVSWQVGLYRGPTRADTDTVYVDGVAAERQLEQRSRRRP
jgi:Polysaccharide lyase